VAVSARPERRRWQRRLNCEAERPAPLPALRAIANTKRRDRCALTSSLPGWLLVWSECGPLWCRSLRFEAGAPARVHVVRGHVARTARAQAWNSGSTLPPSPSKHLDAGRVIITTGRVAHLVGEAGSDPPLHHVGPRVPAITRRRSCASPR
jgi:hypothetical protein